MLTFWETALYANKHVHETETNRHKERNSDVTLAKFKEGPNNTEFAIDFTKCIKFLLTQRLTKLRDF